MDVILGHDDFLQQRGRSVLTPAETIEDKRIIDPEIKVVRMRSPLLSNILSRIKYELCLSLLDNTPNYLGTWVNYPKEKYLRKYGEPQSKFWVVYLSKN